MGCHVEKALDTGGGECVAHKGLNVVMCAGYEGFLFAEHPRYGISPTRGLRYSQTLKSDYKRLSIVASGTKLQKTCNLRLDILIDSIIMSLRCRIPVINRGEYDHNF